MRIFLFILSILSLLLAAHRFSLPDGTGQYKGGLFFLLMGIQLLIAAALISEHRERQRPKASMSEEKEDGKGAEPSAVNSLSEQGKKS